MGGRDHSYECETCGLYRGGLNDLRCDCDPCEVCGEHGDPDCPCLCGREALVRIHLSCLAANLTVAAALCRAFMLGHNTGWTGLGAQCPDDWFPGCQRSAP